MEKYFKAKSVYYNEELIQDAYLVVEDGLFSSVTTQAPKDAEIVDYSDYIIAPGYVETHIHGYAGHDVMDNDIEGIKVMAEGLLSTGVTSWLPTTLTDSRENITAVCQTIGDHYQEVNGAKIRGIFLEGPFFTEKYKGAQNPKYMGDPSIEILKEWCESSNHLVKKIAIAPERDHVSEFVEYAKNNDVRVALAHSNATYDEAKAAVDKGANIFIHTYNGMSGLHHREPGMVGAAMTLPNVFAEIICDGHHVHPAAVKALYNNRTSEEMILITDSMRAAGQGEGMSRLGEFEVIVKDGAARLKDGGSLAGSILEMDKAVQNVVEWGICSTEEAIKMASANPAKSVGIDHQCGVIKEGYDADFIILDHELDVIATYVDGVKRFEK